MSLLGLTNFTHSLSIPSHQFNPHFFPFPTKYSLTFKPRKSHPLPLFASNNTNNGLKEDGTKSQEQPSSSNGQEQKKPFLGLNWNTLLEPDPDNVVALGLTGILTWASVQVLWQLLFISLAILVAALKYSFIAALLIFILITLL